MLRVLGNVWSAQLAGLHQLAACASEAAALAAVRCVSTKRGRRSDFKSYDQILEQWRRSQPNTSGSGSKSRRGGKHAASSCWNTAADPFGSSSSRGKDSHKGRSKTQRQQAARKQRSKASAAGDFKWTGAWQHTWSDAARAQAAAAAQLDPEELHNLVFGQDEEDVYGFSNGSSNSSKDRRRQRREQRRQVRRMQARAARERAAGSSFGYAEFAYWSDDDSGASSDDEDHWQAYGSHGQQQRRRQQQQHSWWGADNSRRPDWQWWTEEQERQWFDQTWRQQERQQGWQQQHNNSKHGSKSSNGSSSSSSNSSSSSRPWWEQFQQSYEQQQRQHASGYQRQHQQQQSSQHSRQQEGAGIRHPHFVLQHLAALGLPSNAALQRAQIKAAFHKAAMQWHPDKHPEPGAKVAAEAKFKLVKEAYESLVMQAAA